MKSYTVTPAILTWITVIYLSSICDAQTSAPTLTISDSDKLLDSPAFVLNQTDVTFKCSFTSPEPAVLHQVFIRSKRNSSSQDWVDEAQCLYVSSSRTPSILNGNSIGSSIVGGKDSITCLDDLMSFVLRIKLDMPSVYSCLIRNLETQAVLSTSLDVTLRSYSKPTGPVITQEGELTAGEQVTFTCSSIAKPPPKLTFEINGLETRNAILTPSGINSDMDLQQSVLKWTLDVTKDMHNKKLVCETEDHAYTPQISASQDLLVVYGPEGSAPIVEEYNINSDDLTLTCSMDGYPELTYQWLHNKNPIAEGREWKIAKEYYEGKEFPVTLTFECLATNTETDPEQAATQEYTITLKAPPSTSAHDSSSGGGKGNEGKSTGDDGGLEDWMIAVIAVAAAVVFIIILTIIICCVRKNKSSKKNSKAMQARRSSDERTDDHSMTKYQSSTSSLARQSDPRATYHENPTLPADYRYSHGNVEQYAEVIDDMPRSRKPIALEDLDRLDDMGPPQYGEAPPAYSSGSLSPYGRNEGYHTPSYDNSYVYGAAC